MDKLKILIAVDDPLLAKIIAHTACNIVDAANSEITLINVLETTFAEEEYFYRKPEKFIEHEAQKADFAYIENFLENEKSDYKGFIYRQGDAAELIINEANSGNYDLVVVGSHNKQGLQRFFLGSVSYKTAKYCKKSVLVIKPDSPTQIIKDKPYSVLLAVDGSEYSTYTAGNIGKFLDKNRAEIVILNVTLPIFEVIPADSYVYTNITTIMEDYTSFARETIRNAAISVAKQQFTVNNKYYVTGDPAFTIIKEAEKNNNGLIVVGSQGQTGISGWLMGSVSSKVYEHSPLPVLIVKK